MIGERRPDRDNVEALRRRAEDVEGVVARDGTLRLGKPGDLNGVAMLLGANVVGIDDEDTSARRIGIVDWDRPSVWRSVPNHRPLLSRKRCANHSILQILSDDY